MTIGHQLIACGRKPIPDFIQLGRHQYKRSALFKHDFFAATTLYTFQKTHPDTPAQTHKTFSFPDDSPPEKIILKIARCSDFLGLPLSWLGRLIRDHEWTVLKKLRGIPGIPVPLNTFENTGFIYTYIEGCSLDSKPKLPDDFFDRLETILRNIHRRHVAYIDLNKRGNILLCPDGKPALIDFQISFCPPFTNALRRPLVGSILKNLQKDDLYHLNKHKRRFRPDLMDPLQIEQSRTLSRRIKIHRKLTRPLTRLRRMLLAWLFKKGHLINKDISGSHPETNPKRWLK